MFSGAQVNCCQLLEAAQLWNDPEEKKFEKKEESREDNWGDPRGQEDEAMNGGGG